ncbi:MAG: acyl carrier protein, partial [Alphaproteobacteria bacterium]|nr:acyl carrier protein [Alphaproteobacteria bacterium]
MARRPAPTIAWVRIEVVTILAKRSGVRPSRITGASALTELGITRGTLVAFVGTLQEWPSFRARGLRLNSSDLVALRTVGDLIKLVHRSLSASAPTAATRAPRRAAKKAARKLAKKAARKKGAKKEAVDITRAAKPVRKAKVKKGAARKVAAKKARPRVGGGPGLESFELRAPPGVRVGSPRFIRNFIEPGDDASEGSEGSEGPPSAPPSRGPRRASRAKPPPRGPLPPRPERYANAYLLENGGDRILDNSKALARGILVWLRLDIGERAADSQVENPQAIDKHLPAADLQLDVMVSSTDFAIRCRDEPTRRSVAHDRFFLPGDGSAAKAADGGKYVSFLLEAPQKPSPAPAHARIGFYYKNVLVQSQQLIAHVGADGGFKFVTDYTLSADLTGLEAIPERPRLSLFTNANGDGEHQIVLRHPGDPPPGEDDGKDKAKDKGFTIAIKPTVDASIQALRRQLTLRAPEDKARDKAMLIEDLEQLAPLGRELFNQLPGQVPQWMFQDLRRDPEKFVVQVTRPSSSSFVMPWSFVYDIPLMSDVT